MTENSQLLSRISASIEVVSNEVATNTFGLTNLSFSSDGSRKQNTSKLIKKLSLFYNGLIKKMYYAEINLAFCS